MAAKEEIKNLIKQIEAEQGNLSQYTDRQAKAATDMAALEIVRTDTEAKLAAIEIERADAAVDKKALEAEVVLIKKDMEDVELTIQKIKEKSPVLKEMLDQGDIDVVGGMYDVVTGKVEFYS